MPDIVRILYTKQEIADRIKSLSTQIAKDYKNKKPVLVGVLKGSFIFFSDLLRALYEEGLTDITVDFITVSSYGSGTTYSGKSKVVSDVTSHLEGRNVLIIEDIVDTGHTLVFLLEHLNKKHPASLKTAVILDKEKKREVAIQADYVGFTLDGTPWIEGYGLDGGEYGRGRPDIAEKIVSK